VRIHYHAWWAPCIAKPNPDCVSNTYTDAYANSDTGNGHLGWQDVLREDHPSHVPEQYSKSPSADETANVLAAGYEWQPVID
jgi:hypothetical protein